MTTVCGALQAHGAKLASATTAGYGGAKPAVIGGKARDRHENRRVVVLVTR